MDINAGALNVLMEEEFGIWETPEGTTYIDGEVPLMRRLPFDSPPASARDAQKRRGTEKGQRCRYCTVGVELHRSLANKKTKVGGAGGLSKETHALVHAQLTKEAAICECIGALRAQLLRELVFVRSVVAGGGESIKSYVGPIAECFLQGAMNPGCA